MILLAGPCVIESEDISFRTCEFLCGLRDKYGLEFYFKSSFDKANRSSVDSFRGPGIEKGIEIFNKLKEKYGVKIVTDVHSTADVDAVKNTVDMVQVPAFLCRQTDLLEACAKSGRDVNVKKGQFLAPWEMGNVAAKLRAFGTKELFFTERGSSFGYNNLVVDFRSFPIMKSFGVNVIFDATHSVQLPGAKGGSSGGQREFVPYLARGAAACGVDGFFMEVHPDPDKAMCDGPNMLNFEMMEKLMEQIINIRKIL